MNKKPFPPTLKERRRYMVLKIHSKEDFTRDEVIKALWNNAFENLGSFDTANSSFWLMDFDKDQQKGILRTNNKKEQKVRTSITLLDEIKNQKAFISIEKESGTLKKAREKLKKEA